MNFKKTILLKGTFYGFNIGFPRDTSRMAGLLGICGFNGKSKCIASSLATLFCFISSRAYGLQPISRSRNSHWIIRLAPLCCGVIRAVQFQVNFLFKYVFSIISCFLLSFPTFPPEFRCSLLFTMYFSVWNRTFFNVRFSLWNLCSENFLLFSCIYMWFPSGKVLIHEFFPEVMEQSAHISLEQCIYMQNIASFQDFNRF